MSVVSLSISGASALLNTCHTPNGLWTASGVPGRSTYVPGPKTPSNQALALGWLIFSDNKRHISCHPLSNTVTRNSAVIVSSHGHMICNTLCFYGIADSTIFLQQPPRFSWHDMHASG